MAKTRIQHPSHPHKNGFLHPIPPGSRVWSVRNKSGHLATVVPGLVSSRAKCVLLDGADGTSVVPFLLMHHRVPS